LFGAERWARSDPSKQKFFVSFFQKRNTSFLPMTISEMQSWADRELAHWRLHPPSRPHLERTLHGLNNQRRTLYVFQFADGDVRIVAKDGSRPEHDAERDRAQQYLGFFRRVLPLLPADYEATICVCLADWADWPINLHREPIFCFQRTTEQLYPMLPDIDLLGTDFIADPSLRDPVAYADKENRAVFAGSTTGGKITEEVARKLSLPRLRAAAFFQGNPKVDFRLPGIVQTSSPEAAEILAQQSFCQAPRLEWAQQFKAKFLLSIDGNGATCSRVAVALASNSVLMKYASNHMLYYFPALEPWRHYLPIERDADVEALIDAEEAEPGRFAAVSEAARIFFAKYINSERAIEYTANLLRSYAEILVPQISSPPASPPRRAVARGRTLAGETFSPDRNGWVGTPGSGVPIGAYMLLLQPRADHSRVWCQAVLRDGSLSPVAAEGQWARGEKGSALHGLRLQRTHDTDAAFSLEIEATFVDGGSARAMAPGPAVRSATGAGLEAFRVKVK
jgi:hypothetical protein